MKDLYILNVEDIIQKRLLQVFTENQGIDCVHDILDRKFIAPKHLFKDALLFLGINPSLSDHILNEKINYYDLTQDNNVLTYFKKFDEIAKYVDWHWTHLDLLFFRETKQSTIDCIIDKSGLKFIYDQLNISKSMIEAAKPKIIIASNTKVRQFLGFEKDQKGMNEWMGFTFKFNSELGTYEISNNNLPNTPIFFTGMLSGQRALDRGSYERLKWHIKYVLNKIQ